MNKIAKSFIRKFHVHMKRDRLEKREILIVTLEMKKHLPKESFMLSI